MVVEIRENNSALPKAAESHYAFPVISGIAQHT